MSILILNPSLNVHTKIGYHLRFPPLAPPTRGGESLLSDNL